MEIVSTPARYQPRDSVLGEIVGEVYRFVHEGKRNPRHLVRDAIEAGTEVRASDYFYVHGKRGDIYVVKPERLPLELHVKSVVYSRSTVNVETAQVDFNQLAEAFNDSTLNVSLRGRSVFSDEGRRLISTYTRSITHGKKDMRTLLTIEVPYADRINLPKAISALDVLYNQNCFVDNEDDEESVDGPARDVRIAIEQRLALTQEMQRTIRAEQLPMLIPLMEATQSYILARRIRNSKVLRMTGDQLRKEVDRAVASNPALQRRD